MNLLSTACSPSAKNSSAKTRSFASAWRSWRMTLTRWTGFWRPAAIGASLSAQPRVRPASSCSTGTSFGNTCWRSFGRPTGRYQAGSWLAASANARGRTRQTGGFWQTLRGAWDALCARCGRECPEAKAVIAVLLQKFRDCGPSPPGYAVKTLGRQNHGLWQVNLKIKKRQIRVLYAPYHQMIVLFRIHKKGSPQEQERAYELAGNRKREFEANSS
jgi:hypothetical protein